MDVREFHARCKYVVGRLHGVSKQPIDREYYIIGHAEIRNFSSSIEKYFNMRREISYLQASMQFSFYYIKSSQYTKRRKNHKCLTANKNTAS